ncbi:MAG: hypothetical protein ACI9VL_001704, partial [Colwellia sp.]
MANNQHQEHTQVSNSSSWQSIKNDWGADKQNFDMPWGKLMMWI